MNTNQGQTFQSPTSPMGNETPSSESKQIENEPVVENGHNIELCFTHPLREMFSFGNRSERFRSTIELIGTNVFFNLEAYTNSEYRGVDIDSSFRYIIRPFAIEHAPMSILVAKLNGTVYLDYFYSVNAGPLAPFKSDIIYNHVRASFLSNMEQEDKAIAWIISKVKDYCLLNKFPIESGSNG